MEVLINKLVAFSEIQSKVSEDAIRRLEDFEKVKGSLDKIVEKAKINEAPRTNVIGTPGPCCTGYGAPPPGVAGGFGPMNRVGPGTREQSVSRSGGGMGGWLDTEYATIAGDVDFYHQQEQRRVGN